jgi:hypothetical protein
LQISYDASGTLSDKFPCCSFTNTAGTARYYRNFAFQSSHHRSSNQKLKAHTEPMFLPVT